MHSFKCVSVRSFSGAASQLQRPRFRSWDPAASVLQQPLAQLVAPSVPFLAAAAIGAQGSGLLDHHPLHRHEHYHEYRHYVGGIGRRVLSVLGLASDGSQQQQQPGPHGASAGTGADPDAEEPPRSLSSAPPLAGPSPDAVQPPGAAAASILSAAPAPASAPPSLYDSLVAQGQAAVDAAFATLQALGVPHYSASDTDLLPEGMGLLPRREQARAADAILLHLEAAQAATGITPLSIHAVLDSGEPNASGAVTSPCVASLAAAAADVAAASEAAHRLRARYLVLPCRGEGYDCFPATHARRELDHLGRFLHAVTAHRRALGGSYTLVLEPGGTPGGSPGVPWVPDAQAAAWLLAHYELPSAIGAPAALSGGGEGWRIAGAASATAPVEAQAFFCASFGALGLTSLPVGVAGAPALDLRRVLLLHLVCLMQGNCPGVLLEGLPLAGAGSGGLWPHHHSCHHDHHHQHHAAYYPMCFPHFGAAGTSNSGIEGLGGPLPHRPHYHHRHRPLHGSPRAATAPALWEQALAPWVRTLDLLADAAFAAERLLLENTLATWITRRYSGFDAGIGRAFETGERDVTLAALAALDTSGNGNGGEDKAAVPAHAFAPPLLLRPESSGAAGAGAPTDPASQQPPLPPPPSLLDFERLVDAYLQPPPITQTTAAAVPAGPAAEPSPPSVPVTGAPTPLPPPQ